MTGIVLGGGRGVPKDDVPQKGAQGHGDHDPSVVRHEDQPAREPTSQPPSPAGLSPSLFFFFSSLPPFEEGGIPPERRKRKTKRGE